MTSEPHAQLIDEVSATWVESLSEKLLRDGRRLEGGWPGTLSEARRLTRIRLAAVSEPTTGPTFDRVVKVVYDRAKSRWLAIAGRAQSS